MIISFQEKSFNDYSHYRKITLLQRYFLDLILPLYKAVGFEDNINDPYLVQLTREIAVKWACRMGHKDCLDKVLDLYRRWMMAPDDIRWVQCGGEMCDCVPYTAFRPISLSHILKANG